MQDAYYNMNRYKRFIETQLPNGVRCAKDSLPRSVCCSYKGVCNMGFLSVNRHHLDGAIWESKHFCGAQLLHIFYMNQTTCVTNNGHDVNMSKL